MSRDYKSNTNSETLTKYTRTNRPLLLEMQNANTILINYKTYNDSVITVLNKSLVFNYFVKI